MKTIAMLVGAAVLALSANAIAQQASPPPPPPPPPGAPMDPMGDRTLTRTEADAQARKMFAKMDVNKDGKIDKADREARQAEKFRKLDTDGNGSLSPGEFAARGDRKDGPGREGKRMGMRGHGPMGGPGGGMGMMMLRMADANKDGAVTEAEFLDAHARHFAMLDTNKDGSVTAQERRAAMTKMRDHMKQMRGGQHDGMKHGAGHEHPAGA